MIKVDARNFHYSVNGTEDCFPFKYNPELKVYGQCLKADNGNRCPLLKAHYEIGYVEANCRAAGDLDVDVPENCLQMGVAGKPKPFEPLNKD